MFYSDTERIAELLGITGSDPVFLPFQGTINGSSSPASAQDQAFNPTALNQTLATQPISDTHVQPESSTRPYPALDDEGHALEHLGCLKIAGVVTSRGARVRSPSLPPGRAVTEFPVAAHAPGP